MITHDKGIVHYVDHVFPEWRGVYKTAIKVIKLGTFEAAGSYSKSVCLNFGSKEFVGGGYESVMDYCGPIRTQEEDLFRRSDLPSKVDLMRNYYPLADLAGIYCGCKVLKDAYLRLIEPFETGIITVPAVIEPDSKGKIELGRKKMRLILDIAADNMVSTLILGAWGCGAYNNDAMEISGYFKKLLLNEYSGVFEKVIFAIPGGVNYEIFNEVMGR